MPRYLPDSVLLQFSSLPVAPGCPELRADFVRLALGVFAGKRRYERFEAVVRSAGIETLKGVLLAVTDAVENEDGHYNRAFKVAAPALGDEGFRRLAELCSDVLDWDTAWDAEYIARAWPVLCDELEYEQEPEEENWTWNRWTPYEHLSEYTANEARSVSLSDRRRWPAPTHRRTSYTG